MDSAGALTRAVERFAADHLDGHRQVCVGLSGGPDSLALTAAAVRAGFEVRALVVDHRLQHGSAHVADAAAVAARGLGARAQLIEVSVGTAGGMEAAARTARYAALEEARDGWPVLLGHTADDQAETVLLGLARGSGARSIAGMRAWSAPWGRPFLGVRRAQTVGACTELGLAPHADAHNRDPRFTRVRLRSEVLPLLDDVVHGGVVEALCRTADALRADTDALDALAEEYHRAARTDAGLAIERVRDLAAAVRTRVIRRWLLDVGATEPTSRVIGAVDALVVDWHGQGGVAVGGDGGSRREVARVGDVLTVRDSPR
ncbi:tRNA(Ile)-lysidine synthase [Gordonia polyisoprenivorans NBRC 16320 = JCM 10675]|uniref:tRNA(Ile)-lysidine synthase n=1 Tax=Gordonia polyisoprenivorans TaxID=84595 RepID=A0A846WKI3_9ACTN|nr:tRNA lysidine(34) synthetase TilS [Gordonia polyisoprenivorans]NKY01729.1 tRNA lysidine(34) synthetase TilS [Gordonia polyisoprenivorans]WCB36796.1 tRNA lysidine(34) synthetase TilS [Gordonia polyisoprenivorans]GAB25210.1 tRNA(Ile)-lysidine synthase [Gordonia polyisoprenivorans NBRC 16320 = JCM 10675]